MPKKYTVEQRAIANADRLAQVAAEVADINDRGLQNVALAQSMLYSRKVGVTTLSRNKIAYEQIYLVSEIAKDLFDRGLISWKQIRDARGTREKGGLRRIEQELIDFSEIRRN
jgi:hypothetical protein